MICARVSMVVSEQAIKFGPCLGSTTYLRASVSAAAHAPCVGLQLPHRSPPPPQQSLRRLPP